MNPQDDNSSLSGNERLDDALLREHARAGTGADEAFLSRVERSLDIEEKKVPIASSPQHSRKPNRVLWSLAKVATVMLALVVVGGLTAPMMIRQRKKADRPYASYMESEYSAYAPQGSSVGFPQIPTEPPANYERYGQLSDNPWQTPIDQPLSTFSVDVDTASYTNLRRMTEDGVNIPPDSVRLEEMVNYFDYSYAPPTDGHPFSVITGNAACPWNPDHQLVRVALKGQEIERAKRAPANLVFLLDVSGSMSDPRKLPLVVQAFEVLLEELNASDTISIVVYAGSEGLALPPTKCDAAGSKKVSAALRRLSSGGSTNGGAGIMLAYRMAREHFKPGGINRVILATDGDFNVGVTGDADLISLVEQNAKSNVFLTVLGFGTGYLNDGMMEAITNKGNGTYHYIDSFQEARHVFLQKLMGTLVTIAKDVKIQVEFNPAQVKRYRLLGYANRMLRREDFSDDRIDAGDIGSGHTVTAFYEVETGEGRQSPPKETLRYQQEDPEERAEPNPPASNEWLTVKLRYKQPEGDRSKLIERPFIGMPRSFDEADADFRFGTSVAMAGLLLRETEGMGGSGFEDVTRIASGALGADPNGQREEFLKLMKRLNSRGD
jgi:Ca-activated chloride channel family protein